jgi:hypothetical protein
MSAFNAISVRAAGLAAAILVFLTSCSAATIGGPTPTPDPCSAGEIKRYAEAIRDVSREFADAYTVATSAPRMSLAPVIQDLQAIRREAEDLEVPECAAPAKDALIAYMNVAIEAFTAFMSQKSDRHVATVFERANALLDDYTIEVVKLIGVTLTPALTPTP